MENKFRNEIEISLGDEVILLRPTFENIAMTETHIGSISYLAWKFSRGVRMGDDGKVDPKSLNSEETIKSLPSLTEISQVIYYNQADRKFTLEQVWDLVMGSGKARELISAITIYVGRMLSGGDFDEKKEMTVEEKKS